MAPVYKSNAGKIIKFPATQHLQIWDWNFCYYTYNQWKRWPDPESNMITCLNYINSRTAWMFLLCSLLRLCLVVQLCPTLCNPLDCSPPGSPVHGIFQTRILEWVAISLSRISFWSSDQINISCVSWIAGICFIHWATGEVQLLGLVKNNWYFKKL